MLERVSQGGLRPLQVCPTVTALVGVVGLLGPVFSGCSATEAAESVVYAAPELGLLAPIPTSADLVKPFDEPLPIVTTGASGRQLGQISSCQEWLDLRDPITDSDNGPDYNAVMVQSVTCAALGVLKDARPAKQSALPADFVKYVDLGKYPATLWVSISDEDVAKASRPGLSLKDMTGRSMFQIEDKKVLSLVSGSRKLQLRLLARGDFDHSGWEAAAFGWEGSTVGGSYDVNRLVVLTRRSFDQPFRELPLGSLLPGK